MPGIQTPGRREPVRGDTSLSSSSSESSPALSPPLLARSLPPPTSSSSTTTWRLSPRPANNDTYRDPGTIRTDVTQHSHRAPAAAGTITSGTGPSAYFPPSPPSTVASADSPSASPIIEFEAMHLTDESAVEGRYKEMEDPWAEEAPQRDRAESEDNGSGVERLRHLKNLSASAETHHTNRSSCSCSSESKSPQVSFAQRQKASAEVADHPHRTTSAMPDTPRQTPTAMSPAVAGYAHHPTAAGQRFLCSLFEDLPLQRGAEHVVGTASDAGVDLVCQGWSGAVLDQSRLSSRWSSSAGPLSSDTTGRALYTLLPAAAQAERLREEVLSILDLASEELKCDVVFMAVDRMGMDESDWKAILHGLCYVGGSVVATGGLKGDAGKEKLTGCRVRDGIVLVAVEL